MMEYKTSGDRLHDVELQALRDGGQFTTCGFYKGPGKTGQIIDFPCPEGTIGQTVKVQITSGTSNILELCEVEIYSL
jgi:hypothetical protein